MMGYLRQQAMEDFLVRWSNLSLEEILCNMYEDMIIGEY